MNWRELETSSFGDNPTLADELLALVLEGKKRATCWAVSEGLKGVAIGKSMVELDSEGRPRVVLQTRELVQRRFEDVDHQFAYDEGEGDRSLACWRAAHEHYFARLGLFQPNMMLWCERFSECCSRFAEATLPRSTILGYARLGMRLRRCSGPYRMMRSRS